LKKKVVEKIETYILFSLLFYFSSRAVYEIMWKIEIQPDGQATHDNIIRRMRLSSWKTKATDTHSEYVILIALPELIKNL